MKTQEEGKLFRLTRDFHTPNWKFKKGDVLSVDSILERDGMFGKLRLFTLRDIQYNMVLRIYEGDGFEKYEEDPAE